MTSGSPAASANPKYAMLTLKLSRIFSGSLSRLETVIIVDVALVSTVYENTERFEFLPCRIVDASHRCHTVGESSSCDGQIGRDFGKGNARSDFNHRHAIADPLWDDGQSKVIA